MFAATAAPAFAWEVERNSHTTIAVSREATTAAEDVLVYANVSFPSSAQYSDGSALSTGTGGRFQGATPQVLRFTSGVRGVDYRMTYGSNSVLIVTPDGGRWLLNAPDWYATPVTLVDGTGGGASAVTTANPLPARVMSLPAVNATITSMPEVALESSISVDGTLPVDVVSAGGVSREGLLGAAALALLLGGVATVGLLESRGHARIR